MLDLRIVADGRAILLSDLPSVLGGDVAAREIADQIEGLIAFLDDLGGDPDVELNGDEVDGTAGEDDFYPHTDWRDQPGCPISDPDACTAGEDGDWLSRSDGGAGDPEDAEEDAPQANTPTPASPRKASWAWRSTASVRRCRRPTKPPPTALISLARCYRTPPSEGFER